MDTSCRLDFYLVRHGITKANKEKRYVGWTDVPIIPKISFSKLKHYLQDKTWTDIVSSDLLRCRQTCDKLSVTAREDARLREMHFGDWEMKTYEALKEDSRYRKWLDDPAAVTPPNGESFLGFQARLKEWLEARLITKDSGSILVVTHAGVIRQLLVELGASDTFWTISVPHGKAVKVEMVKEKEGWRCTSSSVVPMQENEAT